MAAFDPTCCFLFDNGSLRAASTLSLRCVAAGLESRISIPVRAVSLLHSSTVPAAELGGEPAQLLERALRAYAEAGGRQAVALPLFFGPSGALREYLPERLKVLREAHPELEVRVAEPLVKPDDDSAARLAAALQRQVRATMAYAAFAAPMVLVTDHGSPQPAVTAVRDRVTVALAECMGDAVQAVRAASMERREGEAYAFNEPLLERALAEAGRSGVREVVVALQFLQAGRHAGPGGDVAGICRAAEAEYPGLHAAMTSPLVHEPEILELLERRWRKAVAG